jgi:hypothetical protein
MVARFERLRQQEEEFQRTVEESLRTTCARVEDLRVRQAKRRVVEDEFVSGSVVAASDSVGATCQA